MKRTAATGPVLFASSCFLAACASTPARPGPGRELSLAEVIDSVTSTPPLDRTHWGIAVRDRQTGEWLARLNAERHFIPASNQKLVVTATALALLGADYRYRTPLHAIGRNGDEARTLLITGSGDPTWSRRFHETDFTVIDSVADLIAASGLRRITGGIALDVTRFPDVPVHGTWEIGDLTATFAPPVDAFAIGEGTFGVVIVPSGPGRAAWVRPLGAAGLQPLVTRIVTDTAGARERRIANYMDRTDAVQLTGNIALGKADTVYLSVTDPAAFAGRALEHALRGRGIEVLGGVHVQRDPAAAVVLADAVRNAGSPLVLVESPPLREIVAAILQPSQNWIAEQVLKTLAAERAGEGSWSAGVEVETEWLTGAVGIDSSAFQLRDASGLSAQNLLAPAAIVQLLEHAAGEPWAEDLRAALPAPGMAGGTLSRRLAGFEDRVRAKTGTITNVNSLSGYVSGDRELVFSILSNGSGVPSSQVRRGIDRIVRALARQGG